MDLNSEQLSILWDAGLSIPELWGYSAPIKRATVAVDAPHLILWGILSIVEYQTNKGAGHRYLRDRLWNGDWLAIGRLEGGNPDDLAVVPKFQQPKFGRKPSAIGDGTVKYTDVRIVHSKLLE